MPPKRKPWESEDYRMSSPQFCKTAERSAPKSKILIAKSRPSIHRRSNKAHEIRVSTGSLPSRHSNAVFSFGDNFHAGCASKAGEYGWSLRSTGGIGISFTRERGPSRTIDPVGIYRPATRRGGGIRAAYAQARIGVGHPGRCRGWCIQAAVCIAPGIGDCQAARCTQGVVLAGGDGVAVAGIGDNRDLLAAFVEGIGA